MTKGEQKVKRVNIRDGPETCVNTKTMDNNPISSVVSGLRDLGTSDKTEIEISLLLDNLVNFLPLLT